MTNSNDELTSEDVSSGSNTVANSYTYSNEGNCSTAVTSSGTASYGWNQANELTSAAGETYGYDGNGELSSITSGSTTTQLTWDPTQQTPTLLTAGTTNYIYGPGDLPVEQIDGSDNHLYYHHDQQGSTRLITDDTGSVVAGFSYGPYGRLIATSGSWSGLLLGYDRELTDPTTGFIYMQARWYDPQTAQFLSLDPDLAQTQQPYEYAGDNPIMNSDPSGMSIESWLESFTINARNYIVVGSRFINKHTTFITGSTTVACSLFVEACPEFGGTSLLTEFTANAALGIAYPNTAEKCDENDAWYLIEDGLSVLPSISGTIENSDGDLEPALPTTVRRFTNLLGGGTATILSKVQSDQTNSSCGCGS